MAFLIAATGYAFTTVFAGLAATITTLPNISRFPAFVAGFTRVFIIARPGMVTLPVFFTSLVTTSAKLVNTLAQSDFFSSVAVAKASAKPVFVKLLTAFIGAMARQAEQSKLQEMLI